MKLIVGLGNPGAKYDGTRHNIGFAVVDRLSRELSDHEVSWEKSEKHKALICRIGDVLLVKPSTFVNESGLAVGSLVVFYKLTPDDVWVIHDDIDLPLGKIRIRQQGGTAGHHGVESIMKTIKSDTFVRFRLGVGRGGESPGTTMHKNFDHRRVIQLVLSRFGRGEAGQMRHLMKHATDAVRTALLEGLDKAMNRFH